MRNKIILICFFTFFCFYKLSFSQTEESLMRAEQLFSNRDFEKAKPEYEKLYQSKNFKDLVYKNYITTLIQLKDFSEAEKIIKKKIKEENHNYTLKIDLGLVYQEQGNIAEAEKIFNDAIRNLPPDPVKVSEVAGIFFNINNYNYALRTFLNGRKIIGDEDLFTMEMINIYRYLRNKEGLAAEFLKILDTNPRFLAMAKSSLSRAFDQEEDYRLLKAQIIRKIQKDPDNTELADLLAWTHLQLKEYDMALIQVIALDKRSNDNGSRVFSLSKMLADNNAYEGAEKGFNYLIAKGSAQSYYIVAKVELLKIKQQQLNKGRLTPADITYLETAYEQLITEYGKSNRTLFALRELAKLKANHLNKVSEAETILEEALEFKGITEEVLASIKTELADIYVLNNNIWDASLLLGQVEKSFPGDPVGQEAKFKNAKISFYNGDFKWAKAQLDVLKASTSQLIANDALDLSLLIQDNLQEDSTGAALKVYARAEFLRFKNQDEKALSTLDSLQVKFPKSELSDDILMSQAKIYTAQNKYEKTIEAYKLVAENYAFGIWADDALYSLGLIYEEQNQDKEKANYYYQKLIEDFPGSLFVIDARKRYRNLRGDAL